MKRILLYCLLPVLVSLYSTKLNAQLNFAINPSITCYVGPGSYTASAVLTNTSPCLNLTGGSYSFVVQPSGATVTPAPGGTTALLTFSACNLYTVTVFAYAPGNPIPCDNTIRFFNLVCPTSGSITAPSVICTGAQATLTGNGAATYTWISKTGAVTTTLGVGSPIVHSPTANTTYTMLGVTAQGCNINSTHTINVQKVNLTVTPASQSLCIGAPANFTASIAAVNNASFAAGTATTGIQWFMPSGALFASTPVASTLAANGTFTAVVTHTGAAGVCTLSATALVNTINVVPVTLTANNASVCPGSAVTITALIGAPTQTTANAFSWTASPTPIASLPTFTGNPITKSINNPTSFTVNVNYYGCTGTQTINVGIATITPTLTISHASVCPNRNFTLTASGGVNYTFAIPGFILPGTPTIPVRVHSLTQAQLTGPGTIYTLTANFNGCVGTATGQVGLHVLNTQIIPLSAPSLSACPNTSVVLHSNHGAGTTHTWTSMTFNTTQTTTTTGAPITSSVTFPLGSLILCHTYTVSTDSVGCKGSSQVTICKLAIKPTFTASSFSICPGSTVTVGASGGAGTNYTWTVPANNTITATNGPTATINPATILTAPIPSLFPHTYSVAVDSAGCVGVGTVSVDLLNITPTLTPSSPSICANSIFSLSSTGGVGTTYTFIASYNFIPSGTPTVPALSNTLSTVSLTIPSGALPGNVYSYTVLVDSAGCKASVPGTATIGILNISSNFSLNVNVNGVPVSSVCPNNNFTVTAVGPPLSNYIFLNSPTQTISPNAATYTVGSNGFPAVIQVVRDSASCLGSQTVAVNLLTLTNINLIPFPNQICANVPFTLVAFGLGAGTQYTLTALPPQTFSTALITNSAVLTITTTTSYSIAADSAGCKTPTTPLAGQITTVTVKPALTFTPSATSLSVCPGLPTTLTIAGAPNYTYTWLAPATAGTFIAGASPASSAIATPSTNATYTINAIDQFGCIGTNSITIGIDPLATLSVSLATSQSTLCTGLGALSTAILSATSNVAGANFTWSPAASLNQPFGSSVITTPSLTTVYTATANNGFGCIGVKSITVSVGTMPSTLNVLLNAFPSATICAGFTSTLSAIGAQSYTWTGSTFTNAIAQPSISATGGSPQATYTVTASNGGSCVRDFTYAITSGSAILMQHTQTSNTTCITNNDPKYSKPVTLQVSGASTYVWFPYNPAYMTYSLGSTTQVRPPTTTNYTVIGSNAVCSGTKIITVTVVPQFSILVTPAIPSMCLGDSIKLDIVNVGPGAVGPVTSYTYTWKEAANAPPISLSNVLTKSVVAFPQNSTIYTVEVHDSRECVSLPRLVSVTVLPRPITAVAVPTINGLATNTVCYVGLNPGAPDNILTLTANNKNTNLAFGVVPTYTWLSPYSTYTSILTPVNNNVVVVNAPVKLPSIVVYTVLSGYNGIPGCARYDTVAVRVVDCRPVTKVKFAVDDKKDDIICARQCITFRNLTDTMAGGVQKLLWKFDGGSPATSTDNIVTVCYNLPGSYNVILSVENPYPILKADGGSGSSQTVGVLNYVKVVDIPNVTIFSPGQIKNDTIIRFGQSVSLNGSGAISYSWTPAYNITSLTGQDVTVRPFKTTQYILTGYNSKECFSSDTVNIIVIEDCGEMFVPNAFSPNGDGHNDVLQVKGICLQSLSFMIFNRWGEKVFETTDQEIGWDGNYRGEALNSGVYVFRLEGKTYDGKSYSTKGNITLVR